MPYAVIPCPPSRDKTTIKNCILFRRVALIFLIALGVTGCGVQRGRFVTTGSESNALLPPVGAIDIVRGYETKPAHETGNINEENLLYIVIVIPGVKEHGSSSRYDYGKYVTTLSHTWNTDPGAFTISISWNRQTDMVMIGKQEYIRKQGNAFILRLNPDGEISGQQLVSLGSHVNCQGVLQNIQEQMPNDHLIASLKLAK